MQPGAAMNTASPAAPAPPPKHQLNQAETHKLLGNIQIPPQPEIVRALIIERNSDDPDIQRIAQLISKDVGLSAAMLKAVNSPYYGLRSKIGSIAHAASLLGMKNIGTLVMGLALRASTPIAGMERYWESTSRSAQLASLLARRLALGNAEDAQLYTLVHDSAMPLLMQRFPDYRQTMREIVGLGWVEVTAHEDARHNTNHAAVGGLLASNWGLPDHIRMAITLHHDITVFIDEKLPRAVVDLIAIGHIAEHVENALSQQMNDSAWEEFGASCRNHLMLGEDELQDFTDTAKELFGMDGY